MRTLIEHYDFGGGAAAFEVRYYNDVDVIMEDEPMYEVYARELIGGMTKTYLPA